MTRREFLGGSALAATGLTMTKAAAATGSKPLSEYAKGPLGKIVGELPPGRYDAHIHVFNREGAFDPKPEEFWAEMQERGMSGGCLFSYDPNPDVWGKPSKLTPEEAMDNCIAWCSASPTLYPFYRIDPGAPDALELVDRALEKGFYGFKVIYNRGLPCNERTMSVYRKIAAAKKPLTFHTGILYDGLASSQYFRPVCFEPLLEVPGLRFAMAHVSWPWHDECLAFYGKIRHAALPRMRNGKVPTLYLDTTPGPPRIYRREVLEKTYTIGHNVTDRVMFGHDRGVSHYDPPGKVTAQMRLDDGILTELGLGPAVLDSYYRLALQHYLFGD